MAIHVRGSGDLQTGQLGQRLKDTRRKSYISVRAVKPGKAERVVTQITAWKKASGRRATIV